MTKVTRRRALAVVASALAAPSIARAEGPQLAERLADYALSLRYEDIDTATIEQAKSLIVDSFACAIAAFDEHAVKVCRTLALAPGDGAFAGLHSPAWRRLDRKSTRLNSSHT